MEKLNTSALMGKWPLNSVVTKDKEKAVITAIKYSAPDRAMLFNFYNHPQPLWVWADRTSISPRKLSLHVDVRERVNASIKGEGSNPEKGLEKKAKNQSLPVRAEEKDFLGKHGLPLCDYHEHHDQPLSGDQGLAFQPTLYKAMLFNFYNHPQPLWVWVDRTSISPRKLSLHVDVRERVKASIKGEWSNPEKGLGKKAKNQSLTVRAKEKDFLGKHGLPLCDYHEHHD